MRSGNSIYTPGGFHGIGKEGAFFEGWYVKCADASGDNQIVLIPGVSLGDDAHAFVQVLTSTGQSVYHRFELDDFVADTESFDVWIGPNHFSLDGLSVDLPDDALPVRGKLRFGPARPWPVAWWAPGAMGPFAFAPAMECYHAVLSFSHSLSGALQVGKENVLFGGGVGYIEKDWGRSFPGAYFWMHSNYFLDAASGDPMPDTSLSLSIARIPWIGFSFTGVIAGLLVGDKLYRLATWNGARVTELVVNGDEIRCVIAGPFGKLEVELTGRGNSGALRTPTIEAMRGVVAESMTGQAHVRLTKRGSVVFDGAARCVASELVNHEKLQ